MTDDQNFYPIALVGERVILREFAPDDLDAVALYAANAEVTRHLVWGPQSRAETNEWLARALSEAREVPRQHFALALLERSSGRLVGTGRISVVSRSHRVGSIGYVLNRAYWGRGYASEMAGLLVTFGFQRLDLHRIEATCDPANMGSRRVLEKCGMRYEGHAREHLWVRGAWRDSLLYAILEQDWRNGKHC